MYRPHDHLGTNAWMKLAVAYSQMAVAAGEVITHRVMRMSRGAMSGAEAVGMLMEKQVAFAAAAERAAVAAATGAHPAKIAAAALKPIRAKARSNVRKLRR